MCGISGIVDLSGTRSPDALARMATAMADAMVHRGPDMAGCWVDGEAGVALSFRRLSIVDLSAAGSQPMVSASGRHTISYNGEVYNRDELIRWIGADLPELRGHSDTEVLLEACERFGVREAVQAAIGMFAISLWNRQSRTLHLVRDRLGIKPLYWLHQPGDVFAFASELHALRTIGGLDWSIDRHALRDYLRYAYVPAPRTIHANVHQLMPGEILTFPLGGERRIESYWSLSETIEAARAAPFTGSDKDATDQLDALMRDAVGRRMTADVPLGAFLSGGYDSSTVTALMQAQSERPIKTFSIGFDVDAYNEADHADAVAGHLKTDHTRFNVTSREALAVIPRLPEIYDQPFADPSQIPTFLVSQLARQHVTVALSGDGGDEAFAGYNRHRIAQRLERTVLPLPMPLRRALSSAIRSASPTQWDRVADVLPRSRRPQHPGEKLHKFADMLDVSGDDAHRALTSLWQAPEQLMAGDSLPHDNDDPAAASIATGDLLSRMQYGDTVSYLPGDVLTKVDRASMATSLEVRVPLIDHRILAYAWSLPVEMKVRDGQGKWLLRQVLYRYVPAQLVDRPKMGFGVPIDDWLRGPLRDWAEDLLSPAKLRDAGLNPEPIRSAWTNHVTRRENKQYGLWIILMYQAWHDAIAAQARPVAA